MARPDETSAPKYSRWAVFDGTTMAVNDAALVQARDNTALTLRGTIDNTGTISVNANSDPSGHPTDLLIDGAVTLDGHGQVAFDGASQSIITGTSAAATLTNVDNTISGGGQLGNGQLTLVNDASGVIDGSGLILDTGSNTIVNQGLIEGSVGTLTVHSTMNNAGLIDAYRGVVYLEATVDNSGMILAGQGGRGGRAGRQRGGQCGHDRGGGPWHGVSR
jgi:hypothetical protein